jgi:hypothetical protein
MLEALCSYGVDGTWLLVGEGPMWRPGREPAKETKARRSVAHAPPAPEADPPRRRKPRDVDEFARIEAIHLFKRLGLEELALLASKGVQRGMWHTKNILDEAFPNSLSLTEICSKLAQKNISADPTQVAADLTALLAQGWAMKTKGRAGARYRGAAEVDVVAHQPRERAEVAADAIYTIANVILPASLASPERGKLITGHLLLPAGRSPEIMRQIRDAVRKVYEDVAKERGKEKFNFILGLSYVAAE